MHSFFNKIEIYIILKTVKDTEKAEKLPSQIMKDALYINVFKSHS